MAEPAKSQKSHINNGAPRVEKIATTQAEKPVEEAPIEQVVASTPVIEEPAPPPAPEPVPVATANPQPIAGNKEAWMAAAGIPQNDWWAVDQIVSKESGWKPCAYNPNQNNCNLSSAEIKNHACGLAQSLPCGKQEKYGHWTDPVANLKWQKEYVKERYGGYVQALSFWNTYHWY